MELAIRRHTQRQFQRQLIHMVNGKWLKKQQRQKKGLRVILVQCAEQKKQHLFQRRVQQAEQIHQYQEMQRYITLQNQEQQVTSIVLQEA